MCHNPYADAMFFKLLLEYDRHTALLTKTKGCQACGCLLDTAHYQRKPRGVPPEITEEFNVRYSFCCRKDGCRKRATPPSTRFLGPHVYILLTIVLSSSSPRLMSYVVREFKISTKTLKKWQKFWMTRFKSSAFWRVKQSDGRILQTAGDGIPDRLIAAFANTEGNQHLGGFYNLLKFLAPFPM
jgi:hypothetical protein